MKAAFHVARTGRCGPVLVDVPARRPGGRARLPATRTPSTCPAGGPRRKVHPLQIREAARAIAHAEKPVLYVGGGTLNGDACDELRDARRGRRPPGDHDADGQGRVPGDARAPLRLARHARAEVVEHRDEHVRRARRGRRPLRRPRHRQALGVRARGDRRPPRHRPGRDLQAARRRHPRRRPAQDRRCPSSPPRSRKHRAAGAPRREAWLRKIADWRDEFPLRYGTGGDWLKPQKRDGDAAGAHRRRRRDLHDRRRPAPDVGDAVPPLRAAAVLHHLGRARDDGLRHPGRDRRQGGPARGDGRLRRRRRLLPDDRQELATAVLDDLPIVVVLVNNGYLGMVTQWQDMFFDGRRSHVHLDAAGARLREARRGLRRRRDARSTRGASSSPRSRRRSRSDARSWSTAASTRPSSASR